MCMTCLHLDFVYEMRRDCSISSVGAQCWCALPVFGALPRRAGWRSRPFKKPFETCSNQDDDGGQEGCNQITGLLTKIKIKCVANGPATTCRSSITTANGVCRNTMTKSCSSS